VKGPIQVISAVGMARRGPRILLDKSGRDSETPSRIGDEQDRRCYADADVSRGTFRWAIGPATPLTRTITMVI
jgi:hypothetical protein